MIPIVLFRKSLGEEEEYNICSSVLPTTEYRSQIPPGSLVIGRYSVLPFYKELDDELKHSGSRLVNSYEQHLFIADVINWANTVLEGLTPKPYTNWGNPGWCLYCER